ncbi:MAG: putative DNA-binding domain-containing protein [Candidatus Melainabacteria bacterium]|nr:putative DNA-binding domain-containing protein [Candidatus Melainabacteria bacterium]
MAEDSDRSHSLEEIQDFVFESLRLPLGTEIPADRASSFVEPSEALTASQRLSIYNQQYWYRLTDSLEEDFSGLRFVLGGRRFKELLQAYLTEHGSRSYMLRDLGAKLADFVESNPELVKPYYDLARDMARFEWAQMIAYDEEALETLDPTGIDAESIGALRVRLQPYMTLLSLGYPLDDFSIALNKQKTRQRQESGLVRNETEEDEPPGEPPAPEKIYLAVHRHNNKIYYKRLEQEEFQVLSALVRGQALSLALAEAESESIVQGWFASWMRLGWLCPY